MLLIIIYCIDRDINASKNILLFLQCEKQGKRRPKYFREKNKYLRYSFKKDK